jgi:predicted branched-subunit amino acid permease
VFRQGLAAAPASLFLYVLFGNFVGFGALAHDLGFPLLWAMLATALIWAGPAQVILVTTLGSGAALLETAVAVSLSGVRLLPMVVSLLPVLRVPGRSAFRLVLPAHWVAVNTWVEGLRLLPSLPREQRALFFHGFATGMLVSSLAATAAGFHLAASLPPLAAAALLFLTPMTFLVSVAANARALLDRLALAFGLVLGPVLALAGIGLDVLWTGLVGGALAYAVRRMAMQR